MPRTTDAKREQIKSCLLKILEDNEGRITPALVVEHARQSDSPLHSEFNWDVEAAAYQHWVHKARHLLDSYKLRYVTTEGRTIMSPLFVRDVTVAADEQGYVSTLSLVDRKDDARATMLYELSRLNAVLIRVEQLAEVLDVGAEVSQLRKRYSKLHTRIERQQRPQPTA